MSSTATPHPVVSKRPMVSRQCPPLNGDITIPGDKSISHRSIMFGALSIGKTTIKGLLEGEDVLATAEAFRQMGASIKKQDDGTWVVHGVGLGGLKSPDDVLDMGNSGTSARLIMGILAGHAVTATMTGDASLRKRPMGRVTKPLSTMGACFSGHDINSDKGGRLPITITGTDTLLPTTYETPMASAQVKSAVLLAGLTAGGDTTVIEPTLTRDHTERMLQKFGATVTSETLQNGRQKITIAGRPTLTGCDIQVPADPSSAAFPLVAGALVAGSEITLSNIGQNKTRTGLFDTLLEMGADITITPVQDSNDKGEPLAHMTIKASQLTGVDVPAERASSMIDEFPILAIAAAYAHGKTRFNNVHELRVKESDRLAAVEAGLKANGIEVESGDDWMVIHGTGGNIPGGGTVTTHLDHRIAMSFLIMGMVAQNPVSVDDGNAILTSFPTFTSLMADLGAMIEDV